MTWRFLATLSLTTFHFAVGAAPLVYQVPSVSIRAPLSEGWRIQQRGAHAITFMFRDPQTDSDFIAVASHFEPHWPSTDAEFLEEFKRHALASQASRRILSSRFQLTAERPYVCARASLAAEQLSNAPDEVTHSPVRVHERVIACRRGAPSNAGLLASFQYVRPSPDEKLDLMAESFFQGVQFSSKK